MRRSASTSSVLTYLDRSPLNTGPVHASQTDEVIGTPLSRPNSSKGNTVPIQRCQAGAVAGSSHHLCSAPQGRLFDPVAVSRRQAIASRKRLARSLSVLRARRSAEFAGLPARRLLAQLLAQLGGGASSSKSRARTASPTRRRSAPRSTRRRPRLHRAARARRRRPHAAQRRVAAARARRARRCRRRAEQYRGGERRRDRVATKRRIMPPLATRRALRPAAPATVVPRRRQRRRDGGDGRRDRMQTTEPTAR